MSFAFSRVLRQADYDELVIQLSVVDQVQRLSGPVHPAQHQHRRWEYALMLAAYEHWAASCEKLLHENLEVGDFGCGIGLSCPIMHWLGHNVSMYEVWVYGNEEEWQMKQMAQIQNCVRVMKNQHPIHRMIHRPLCELILEDYGRYDVSLCISTLEHIGEWERAFRDLCRTVMPGGLLFLTMDFAEDAQDHYQYSWLRAGKMWNPAGMLQLADVGREEGFELLGGDADWHWDNSCRLVNDYGFASLAMTRVR